MRKIMKEKGTVWGKEDNVTRYMNISDGKSYYIVDTNDPAKLAKYYDNYYGVSNISISMLVHESEYYDAVSNSRFKRDG